MDYKKAYNKALERAKKRYYAPNADKIPTYANRVIEEIFPGLGESEDERIREEIIKFIKKRDRSGCDYDYDKWIAWLKKQGNKKPIWSKEDEIGFNETFWAIQQARTIAKDENDMGNLWYAEDWLKSLKERLS